jgi:sulfite reductase alpha subunit-like flavoprotein
VASDREICALTIDHRGQLDYEPGDWLAVLPENPEAAVEHLLSLLGNGGESLQAALRERLSIARVPAALLRWATQRGAWRGGQESPEGADGLTVGEFLETRLSRTPTADELLGMLKPLQPRLYSLASCPELNPSSLRLVVATATHGEGALGLASGYLNRRLPIGGELRCRRIRSRFRLPYDPERDIIMVGPGTGIAPFMGFLERRLAQKNGGQRPGRSWLFFGNRHRACDFTFREELENFQKAGILTRLDLAFSRDQQHKIYVQDRMGEAGAELWQWLKDGAAFYLCGDARRMAKDADAAFLAIIARQGGLSPEDALGYVETLRGEGRYQRDVY